MMRSTRQLWQSWLRTENGKSTATTIAAPQQSAEIPVKKTNVIDESDSDDYDNNSISSERSSTSSIKNNACFI